MKNTTLSIKTVFTLFFVFFGTYSQANITSANFDKNLSLTPRVTFSGTSRGESFGANLYSLLNKNNFHIDRIWFARTVTDLRMQAAIDSFGVEFNMAIRNKYTPGILGSVGQTSQAPVKIGDVVVGSHNHTLPLQLFNLRECHIKVDLSHMLNLDFIGNHSFKIGAFSFGVGHNIALGDAYAVGPQVLGFYTNDVDQYAYAALFSGDILSHILTYDLYAAVLQNKSGTLSDTGAKIYGQEVDRIGRQERGFGKVNFIIAGRTLWTVFDTPTSGKLVIEPYAVYNSDPEQKIEFFGDSSSKLGTVGFATEYKGNHVECSFETATNFGYQRVKSWDRNQIVQENRNGYFAVTNSHVTESFNGATDKALFVPAVQTIVNSAAQGESHNGDVIGTYDYIPLPGATPIVKTLNNAANRFRDGYTNSYEGWMFIADAAVWLYKKDLSLATEIGVASGDDNPNIDTQDRQYSGFISLQEVYSGNRVKSAFVLGGAGRIPRPLSQPTSIQAPNPFTNTVDGLSNLIFGGIGIKWEPKGYAHKFKVNPNIITYFQHYQTKKYDAFTGTELDCNASPHLGVEANVFFDYYPIKQVKIYGVGSAFFPGQHYTDIKGKPLNEAQQKNIDRLDRTGFDRDKIPNIGDDTAVTFSMGIQYSF